MNLNIFIDYHFNSVSSRPMNNMILINNESPGTIYVQGLLIDGGNLCALRAGYRYTMYRESQYRLSFLCEIIRNISAKKFTDNSRNQRFRLRFPTVWYLYMLWRLLLSDSCNFLRCRRFSPSGNLYYPLIPSSS